MIPQLDEIHIPRQAKRLQVEYCALQHAPTWGWREQCTAQAEKCLRVLASAGRPFAMEELATRLLDGYGLASNVPEGEHWLRECANMGSVSAMAQLGARLSDEELTQRKDHEGELWLREAVERGHYASCIELGYRLIAAKETEYVTEGLALLEVTAAAGDRLAMLLLETLETSGRHDLAAKKGQHYWLCRAGADSAQLASAGAYLYGRAHDGYRGRMKLWLVQEATEVFVRGYRQGQKACAVNLAFLFRRGEIADSGGVPRPDELLDEPVSHRNPLALMEKALWLATDRNPNQDWAAADAHVARLTGSCSIRERWGSPEQDSDPEVHLVVGWLVRHGLTADPQGFSPRERLKLVSHRRYTVPSWLCSTAAQGREMAAENP
jgi:hypothetical protein